MSTLILNARCSLYIRLNNEIIYVDFDMGTINKYNLQQDCYNEVRASYANGSVYTYYVLANTFKGSVEVNFGTGEIKIAPDCELRYFEQEEAEVCYAL